MDTELRNRYVTELRRHLPPPLADLAILRMDQQQTTCRRNFRYAEPGDVPVARAFGWARTPEGYLFWREVHLHENRSRSGLVPDYPSIKSRP